MKATLKEGRALIDSRQKLADSSEFGWGVVNKYKLDELAMMKRELKRLKVKRLFKSSS